MSEATYSNKWLAFIGIALISFAGYLDYTVVNVALPTIQHDLGTNLTSLQWIMNSYFLALCVLATIMGRVGDLFGRRRCFYIGSVIFALASLIAGLSSNLPLLILGRLLQGVGGALIFPLGPSLLPQSFPEKERGKAIAWLGSMGGIALALGPVLGGFIVTHWGWRLIFLINIPIILLGIIFCVKTIKTSNQKNDYQPLDIKGMLFLSLSVCGIVLSLIHSQTAGWLNPLTIVSLLTGIMASVFLVKVEQKQANPLVDFKDFSNPLFFSGAALCFLAGMLSAVILFFDPIYLQVVKLQSPQLSGFVLFSIPVAVFIISFFVVRLIARLGIINTILLGLAFACASTFLQIFFNQSTSIIYIIFAFVCFGCMWGLGNTVSIIAAQTAVGHERASAATGTVVTMFNIGGSVGLAISMVIYNFFGACGFKGVIGFLFLLVLLVILLIKFFACYNTRGET